MRVKSDLLALPIAILSMAAVWGAAAHPDLALPCAAGLGGLVLGLCGLLWWQSRRLQHISGVESALKASEERFRRYFDLPVIGVAVTSLDKGWVEVNSRLCEILGYPREELVLKTWTELTHPDDLAADVAQFEKVLAGQSDGYSMEKRFIRKDGAIIHAFIAAQCVRKADGAIDYFVALVEDIDTRKRYEIQLQETNEALMRSNADLEQYAYVASHDLQTPLRNIVGFTQLLERRYLGRLDQDADEYLGFIIDNTKKMASLITDLLEYSRVSSQGNDLSVVSSQQAATQALINLGTDIHDSGACVTAQDLPPVMADSHLLVSLFQNLVGNALKYRAPGRTPLITLSAKPLSPRRWQFTVADNGIGIDPAYHDKIFEIFQRLSSCPDSTGTGIGLSLCRRIVERLGGRIWVESVPNQGSCFHFTLPAAPDQITG